MNRRLTELLERAVPEPRRQLDADAVFGVAVRRRRVQKSWPVAAVVLVAVAVAAPQVISRVTPSAPSAAEVPLQVSALERRQRLPAAAAGAMSMTALRHPGEGSLVATRGSDRIYLTETAGGRLCVVQADESTGGAGHNCQVRSNLLTSGIVLVTHPLVDSGPTTLVVVVPDGYTTAVSGDTRAAVASNVAVLELTSPRETLTVSGPRVPAVTFDVARAAATIGDREPGDAGGPTAHTEANARTALRDVATAARAYQQEHGNTTGFAKRVLAESPALGRQLASLTDTTALAMVGPGRCLSIDLLSGDIDQSVC